MNPVGEFDIYFSNAACGDNCRQIVALCAFLVMSKCRKVDRSCHRDHRHNCTSIDLKSYHICCMQDYGWIVWKRTIVILSWYLHITHTVDICYSKRILSRDDMGSFLLSNSNNIYFLNEYPQLRWRVIQIWCCSGHMKRPQQKLELFKCNGNHIQIFLRYSISQ